MKYLLFLFFISSSFFLSAQEMEKVLDNACKCLTKAVKKNHNKDDFNNAFGECVKTFNEQAIKVDTIYKDNWKFNRLIHEDLKTFCKKFEIIDSTHQYYSTQKETNFVLKIEECSILKTGTYMEPDDKDSTLVIMGDSIQTVLFKDGTYTKSKIEWLDYCAYKLIRIESTNPSEQQARKPGDETVIRIVGIERQKVFTYEVEWKGRFYKGELLKIK